MLQADGTVIFPICLSPPEYSRKARPLQRVGSSAWPRLAVVAFVATSVTVWYIFRADVLVVSEWYGGLPGNSSGSGNKLG